MKPLPRRSTEYTPTIEYRGFERRSRWKLVTQLGSYLALLIAVIVTADTIEGGPSAEVALLVTTGSSMEIPYWEVTKLNHDRA